MTRVTYSSPDNSVTNVGWLDVRLDCFTHFGMMFALILAISFPTFALAIPLQITGQYTGQINGEPVSATATGHMDTTGVSLNHFELEF